MVAFQEKDLERGRTGDFSTSDSEAPTLTTNSLCSTRNSSRNPSLDRLKKTSTVMDRLGVAEVPIRANRYLQQELEEKNLSVVVIALFFISGLVDSNAFASWSCFVGMQSGNTIFAALGATRQPTSNHDKQFIKSLVSIGAFCVGTLFFNLLHRCQSGLEKPTSAVPRTRWIFVLSFFIQAVLVLVAAVMVTMDLVSDQPFIAGTFSSGSTPTDENTPSVVNYLDLLPIILLAFQSAGQVCFSRVLEVIELPTIVLSTLFHDFTADLYGTRETWRQSSSIKDFLLTKNKRQEKRFLAIVFFFLGGLIGGQIYRSRIGMGGTLFVATGMKVVISVVFVFWGDSAQTLDGHSPPSSTHRSWLPK